MQLSFPSQHSSFMRANEQMAQILLLKLKNQNLKPKLFENKRQKPLRVRLQMYIYQTLAHNR